MEQYTSQQVPDILDNISVKSDDTDFLLSSDANDFPQSNEDKMPDYDDDNNIDREEETQTHQQQNTRAFDYLSDYDNYGKNTTGADNNLDFVHRLKFEYENDLNTNSIDEHHNVLMNSMNEKEIEEFGMKFIFSLLWNTN